MFDLTDPDQFKRHVRASFDTTDPSYGTNGDFHWQFASRLVMHAPIQSGDFLVDVATGTAPAAIMAAPQVGPRGRIVGLDISLGILAHARRHITTTGITNITLVCADAEAMPLPARCVDGILCSSAIVWLPDIPHALHDWYEVLRPQGWLAFSCFGGLARQTVIGLLSDLLKPYGQHLPELNARLNSPEKCQNLLATLGYRHITVATGQEQQLPTSAEASFAWAWASRSRFNITLPPPQLVALKTEYMTAFAELASEQQRWNHDYEQYVVAYK
jgi:ubiquinone/menaquinone biosynthesis C-methylase UbiE